MEAQLAPQPAQHRETACQAFDSPMPGEPLPDLAPLSADRERRRIEFRSSLLKARAAFAREDGRPNATHAMRQLSAGLMDRPPARMMAELANAH